MKGIRFNGPGHVLHADGHVIAVGATETVSNDLAEQLAADPYLDVEVLTAKATKKDAVSASDAATNPQEEE